MNRRGGYSKGVKSSHFWSVLQEFWQRAGASSELTAKSGRLAPPEQGISLQLPRPPAFILAFPRRALCWGTEEDWASCQSLSSASAPLRHKHPGAHLSELHHGWQIPDTSDNRVYHGAAVNPHTGIVRLTIHSPARSVPALAGKTDLPCGRGDRDPGEQSSLEKSGLSHIA